MTEPSNETPTEPGNEAPATDASQAETTSTPEEALLDEAIAQAAQMSEAQPAPAGETDAAMAEEIADLKDRLLRSQAELENFRRRTQKEQLDAMKYQSLAVVRDMLPGIDNLQRAIAATEQSGDTENLITGVKMVAQQFVDVLKSHNTEALNPEGQPFDPNQHEALSQVPSAEHDPMTVLQVVETGYKMHDRVIRPAKVLVTCAPPEPAAEEEEAASEEEATES